MPTPMPAGLKLGAVEPKEAFAAFARRGLLKQSFRWQDVWQSEHTRAFAVAGVLRLDVLKLFQDEIETSLAEGRSLIDFKERITHQLQAKGFWGDVAVTDPATGEIRTTRFNDNRLRLIYDVNLRQSAAAGRWERIERNKKFFPFVLYRTMQDEHVRQSHAAWNGLALPVDDAFWQTHYPPNGWRCRCIAFATNERDLQRRAAAGEVIKRQAPPVRYVDYVNPYTDEVRAVPVGIDPGFGYNPGKLHVAEAQQRFNDRVVELERSAPALADAVTSNGDRRYEFLGQRPGLFELPPIQVTQLSGQELGGNATPKALRRAADDLLRVIQKGPGLTNDDTGWLLKINKNGRSKMGDNPDLIASDSQAVAAIEELMRLAVLAERHLDDAKKNSFVLAIYRFFAPLQIEDRIYRVKLTVKEYAEGAGNFPRLLHALSTVEIENAPLGTIPASTGIKPALQPGQPTTGRAISVRDLLRGALRSDGMPFDGGQDLATS